MSIANLTKAVLLATVVGLIAYDLYAYFQGGTEATISWITAQWAYDVPAGVFAIGFVCGHLFWPMKPKESGIKD